MDSSDSLRMKRVTKVDREVAFSEVAEIPIPKKVKRKWGSNDFRPVVRLVERRPITTQFMWKRAL